jgi:hypothetical protein
MSFVARVRPLWILLIGLLGCDGGPSGPSAPSLRVTILGLPSGSAAAVTVSGPGGFSQPVTATQTLTPLTPGTYMVAASDVTAGTAEYSPSPTSQTVAVNSGQVSASVLYSTTTGNLTVNITGLGTSRRAAVTVTGPGGYTRSLDATTTLSALTPGDYTVTAQDVTSSCGATPYSANPQTQMVTVTARTTTSATVSYSSTPTGVLVNLCIDGFYLTQSAQNLAGSVPLVKNRDGYLRVFAIADRPNTAMPIVRVRFYTGGPLPVDSATIAPSGPSTPTAPDESSLTYSWNVAVPGTLIQPGLRIQAEVDPANLIEENSESDNVYPSALPMSLDVRTLPVLNLTFVPVIQSGSNLQGRVTAARVDSLLAMTKKMHPTDGIDAAIHAPYTTTTSLSLQDNNANGAWGTILGEIDARRIAEGSTRYYYGVARVAYTSGVAGVAYVSDQFTGALAALGWDYLPSGSVVAAHELGHNWARNHAPCGGPVGIDTQYPQADGSTGTYGLDVEDQTLEPPTLGDVMGYCDPKWISDYTYRGVMNYLLVPSPPYMGTIASQAHQPCLLVWGHIQDGQLVLEPAFQLSTRPSLPARPGPYSIEGRALDGSLEFAFSFTPQEVADARQRQQNFVFAVPLSSERAARLSSIRVVGAGREARLSAAAGAAAQPGTQSGTDLVEARRTSGGRVGLRWNSRTHPMVMVRDPDTGEVLSFARGGDVQLTTSKGQLELIISNGIRSRVTRMRVTP